MELNAKIAFWIFARGSIIYRKNGNLIEEKAGRQHQDDMTPARASKMRTDRIEGKQLPNTVQREKEKGKWSINRLWEEYTLQKTDSKGFRTHYKGVVNRGKAVYIEGLNNFTTSALGPADCFLLARSRVEALRVFSFDKQLKKGSRKNTASLFQ